MKLTLKSFVPSTSLKVESGWKPLARKPLLENKSNKLPLIQPPVIKRKGFKTLKETLGIAEAEPIVEEVKVLVETPVYTPPEIIKEDVYVDSNIEVEEPITEKNTVSEEKLIDKVTDYLTKVTLEESPLSFQQPKNNVELNNHQDVVRRLRYLESWLTKVSVAGPGGGEVNLAFMDMVIKNVTTSEYYATTSDYYIGVNYAGAVNVYLPANARDGKKLIIKDELGEASQGTNRYITLWPSSPDTIDNKPYAILAYDYGSLTLVYNNGSWRVI